MSIARCPACGVRLAARQHWCLKCGAPARVAIAPTPPWRATVAIVVVLSLLFVAAAGYAASTLGGRAHTQLAPGTVGPTGPSATSGPTGISAGSGPGSTSATGASAPASGSTATTTDAG